MPIISDFTTFCRDNVFTNDLGQFELKLLDPLPQAQAQDGQFCKINALSVVLNWLHQSHGMPKPYPVRKHYAKFQENQEKMSLREIAKKKYGSQVGEVYDPFILISLARDNGYADITLKTEADAENYSKTIIEAINNDKAPVVFFDVNTKTGDVIQANSKWEHAAVVVGYFTNPKSERGFIITQWGQYHWCLATDLADSAAQLSLNRQPETFYKYQKDWKEHAALESNNPLLLFQKPQKVRVANPPTQSGGFKNAILIVNGEKKELQQSLHSNESEALFVRSLKQHGIINS